MYDFTSYTPTALFFGAGKLNSLAQMELPGRKALIVISAGRSMRANGYLERVIDLLAQNNVQCAVFDKILPNPIKSHVMEGAAMAKKEGCDFVIGLGGGSSIDSAKSIAIMATNPGDYWDYISGGTGKGLPLAAAPLPVVAITTTAGTGTEVDPWTVITHEERQEKIGFGGKSSFPVIAIVDPELMLTVPPRLTAFQGFDAFFHAAEGFIANVASPVSDIYALRSMELISKSLPVAVAHGDDLEARSDVALANTLSGLVESTSCCVSEHSIAHAMSALFPELAHGAALIMISEAYFSFFADREPERFAEMLKAMGGNSGIPMEFVERLVALQKACQVYGMKMSDYGITENDLPAIADNAFATMGGLFELDRVKLTRDDVISILRKSWK